MIIANNTGSPHPPELGSEQLHPEIHHKLGTLMVLHEANQNTLTPAELSKLEYYDNLTDEGSSGEYFHDTLNHKHPEEWSVNPALSAEKNALLHSIGNVITSEASTQNDRYHIDWREVSSVLITKAEHSKGSEQETALVGAVTAVQFSSNKTDRIEFLKQVYQANLAEDAARACEASPLTLMIEEAEPDDPFFINRIHRLHNWAGAFRVDKEEAFKYFAVLEKEDKTTNAPSAQKAQKEIIKSYDDPASDRAEAQVAAQEASVAPEKVDSILTDIYKVERFALQHTFLERQIKDVLKRSANGSSALENQLRQARSEADRVIDERMIADYVQGDFGEVTPDTLFFETAGRFQSDIQDSFKKLSLPAQAAFSLEGIDTTDGGSLTREQEIALRYKEVTDKLRHHVELAKFIDLKAFVDQKRANALILDSIAANPDISVGTIASDGAALPITVTNMITTVFRGALANKELRTNPEELRDFAQAKRNKLLRMAAGHFSEFNSTGAMPYAVKIVRNEQGELALEGDNEVVEKDSLDVYASVAMGCPAIRLQHEDRPAMDLAERIAKGTSNYIDQAAASLIDEAYQRGMFDVAEFGRRASLLEMQRSEKRAA